MKKRVITTVILFLLLAVLDCSCGESPKMAEASGDGYEDIEQTENPEVIALTEEIGAKYGICPELLQALIFYESSNKENISNSSGDTGYMQVNSRWHRERMERLGVTDLTDGYSNILVGTDYLMELAGEYQDLSLVLMKYNGDSRADRLAESGQMSSYAERILKLAEELERQHGK